MVLLRAVLGFVGTFSVMLSLMQRSQTLMFTFLLLGVYSDKAQEEEEA